MLRKASLIFHQSVVNPTVLFVLFVDTLRRTGHLRVGFPFAFCRASVRRVALLISQRSLIVMTYFYFYRTMQGELSVVARLANLWVSQFNKSVIQYLIFKLTIIDYLFQLR